MAMITIDTHWITDATAWRCLVASERTKASLSAKPSSSCRVTCWATQVTKRTASTAAMKQHDDLQTPGDDPSTDFAAPEVVPALRCSRLQE